MLMAKGYGDQMEIQPGYKAVLNSGPARIAYR